MNKQNNLGDVIAFINLPQEALPCSRTGAVHCLREAPAARWMRRPPRRARRHPCPEVELSRESRPPAIAR